MRISVCIHQSQKRHVLSIFSKTYVYNNRYYKSVKLHPQTATFYGKFKISLHPQTASPNASPIRI